MSQNLQSNLNPNLQQKITNYFKNNQEKLFALLGRFCVAVLVGFAIFRLFQWLSTLAGYSFDPYLTIALVIIFAFYLAEGGKHRQNQKEQTAIQTQSLHIIQQIQEKLENLETVPGNIANKETQMTTNIEKNLEKNMTTNFEAGYLGSGLVDDELDADLIEKMDKKTPKKEALLAKKPVKK